MGFCSVCGRPCSVCSGEADEFSLLALPKETRHLIVQVLKRMNMHNETDTTILVEKLKPYKDSPKVIANAMKEYIVMKNAPRSIPYLVAIVKGKAVHQKQRKMDALPPRAKGYDNE